MNLPTIQEIEALHKKYSPADTVFNLVWTHCNIVCDIARKLIHDSRLVIDEDLVRVGCMLHDIGVYPLFTANCSLKPGSNYITHGTEGEIILRKEGYPEELWRFASHHTGVGLSKQDIIDQGLPLPVADYLAATDAELLIMYADKFHSKTNPPYFNSFDWYRSDVAKFGEDKIKKFDGMAQKFGKPDLKLLSERYGYAIR